MKKVSFTEILFAPTAFCSSIDLLCRMLKNTFTFVILALFAISAQAQLGGNAVYPFLNVPIAPRVAGVAGAVIANPDADVNFGFWNPALIGQHMHGHMSMNITSLTGDVFFGEGIYSHSFGKAGSFLAGIKYVDYGTMQNTTTQAQVLGTFTAADYSFQMGYGYMLDSNWQFGASMRLINSAYESYTSWGLATDLAAMYQIPKSRLAMTLVLRNIGLQLNPYDQQREPIPFDVRFGISSRFEHVPLRLNLMLDQLQRFDLTYNDPNAVTRDPITGEINVNEPSLTNKILRHVTVGADVNARNLNFQMGYAFRRGYEMEIPTRRSSAGLTFGVGMRISKFRVNYANTNMNVAGRMHHFGITTSLSQFKPKPEKIEE